MSVLVLNAGSSSLKFMIQKGNKATRGLIEAIGSPACKMTIPAFSLEHNLPNATMKEGLHEALSALQVKNLDAVGHRVVHGGVKFKGPAKIDDDVIKTISDLIPLAPLHNPSALAGIQASLEAFPDVQDKNVACFDTMFHTTMPPVAYTYALPYELSERLGIRRYGFHGLSVEYVYERAIRILGGDLERFGAEHHPPWGRMVVSHLGAGCSATAVQMGKSIDTTMGLTPLDGLVMGTRAGSIDPGLFAYIHQQTGMSDEEITNILNKQSGLLGVSGVSSDMRDIMERMKTGSVEERARFLKKNVKIYKNSHQNHGISTFFSF